MMTRIAIDGNAACTQGSNVVTVTGLGLSFTPSPQEILCQVSGDTGLVIGVTTVTGATSGGFTAYLSGLPDSANYILTYWILSPAPVTITPISESGAQHFQMSLSALSGQSSFTITGLNLSFAPLYATCELQSSAGSAWVGAVANSSTLTSQQCTFRLSGALPDGTYTAICHFYY